MHEVHGLTKRFSQQAKGALFKKKKADIDPELAAETFGAQMRQNAMEFSAYDTDQNRQLDFHEFSKMVREREVGIFPEAVLHYRFDALDPDGTGFVHMYTFLVQALRDALTRSAAQVTDVLAMWDEDGDGDITKAEFRKALRGMGFQARSQDFDAIFDEYDFDHSGSLDSRELRRMLIHTSPNPEHEAELFIHQMAARKHSLRRDYEDERVAPALKNVQLESKLASGVQEQLMQMLEASKTRVIDLFRAWDDDFSGTIDRREFRKAVRSLGVAAPKQEIDGMFDTFDQDGSGLIDYNELNHHLRRKVELEGILQAGAAGEIELEAKNKFSLGKSRGSGPTRSKTLIGTQLVIDTTKSLAQQLSGALKKNRARVMDLFREWDMSTDGSIEKWEWRLAMRSLGLVADDDAALNAAVDALFDQVDVDKSGSVEVAELFKAIDPTQMKVAERRKGFDDKNPPLGKSFALQAQVTGGWCPRQRLLERPLCELMGRPRWDPDSRTFGFTGGLLPALSSRLVTAPRPPPIDALPSSMSELSMARLSPLPSQSATSLPPPPPGWAPFDRPPLKPQRPKLRLAKEPSAPSRLQSSSAALRRSESTPEMDAARLRDDLASWFQASLGRGALPAVASASKLPSVRWDVVN